MTADGRWSARLTDLALFTSLVAWPHLLSGGWTALAAWLALPGWWFIARPSWRGLRGFYLTLALALHALAVTGWVLWQG
ncbi:MAG: hypothetical protein KC613_24055 [Myxococcales bacterium]|nr:hypothetical protein [Myxococcales bacterium]MCB9522200.1 hypothetical protein [Myxococcales bacterium]